MQGDEPAIKWRIKCLPFTQRRIQILTAVENIQRSLKYIKFFVVWYHAAFLRERVLTAEFSEKIHAVLLVLDEFRTDRLGGFRCPVACFAIRIFCYLHLVKLHAS